MQLLRQVKYHMMVENVIVSKNFNFYFLMINVNLLFNSMCNGLTFIDTHIHN